MNQGGQSARPRGSTQPGKRVGGSLYVHRDVLPRLPEALRLRAQAAIATAGAAARSATVLRFDADGRTALLAYERFDDEPFPPLAEAWLAPGGSVSRRRFGDNPPILHRKELLLAADDPRRARFARLTAELEARGLFRDSRLIGRRQAWEERLAATGVGVEDHRLVEVDPEG